MNQKIKLNEIDLEMFEEKVYVIAADVLDILKELSRENQKQINSKTIAEKLFQKDTVKNVLFNVNNGDTNSTVEIKYLKTLANTVLDKLSGLVPSHMVDNLCNLKDILKDQAILDNSADWLDSPISIVKKYIDSESSRNNELEDFLKQTMQYLAAIEVPLTTELTSQKQKFSEDREFEDSIHKYMNMMREECNVTDDIESLKMAFFSKIDNINNGIKKKRERDIARLKETEKTIEEMKKRMKEVKREADEIRKKSREMEVEVYNDALTGLYNRKAYDGKIEETLAHVKRYNISSSLMICDIDFFKKINDNFGHNVGDLALKKLAALFKERLRINDFISRYGGEEFAIVLPHTDMNGAKIAGESIRSFIDKSVFTYKNQKIPLTISVGISAFRKDDNITTVFERADNALYLAKKSGRNAVKTEDDVNAEGIPLKQPN